MAYKRPLTARQSYIITILWLLFAIVFVWKVPITLFSLMVLGASAFIVFYPIRKSKRERGNSPLGQRRNKAKRKHSKARSITVLTLLSLGASSYPLQAQCEYAPKIVCSTGREEKKEDKFKLSGYIQAQAQWGEEDAELRVGTKHTGKGSFSRIGLRRGRLKLAYKEQFTDLVFQVDMTERGITLKDAYLKLQAPWIHSNRTFLGLQYVGLTLGVFDRPFGYEIRYSSAKRESPERSHIFNALFPGERDLGAMLSLTSKSIKLTNGYGLLFNLESGLFAGKGVHEESDSRRDIITRLSLRSHNWGSLHWGIGASYYHGYVQQATPNIYHAGTEGYQLNTLANYEGSYAQRRYYGIDAQLCFNSPLGQSELRGEYLWGIQPSSQKSFRSPNSNKPAEGDTYLRPFYGGYAMLVQSLGKLPLSLVLKYDFLDPNKQIKAGHAGLKGISPADLSIESFGFGLLWRMASNLRMQAYYDLNHREVAPQIAGYNRQRAEDTFTLRLQYQF